MTSEPLNGTTPALAAFGSRVDVDEEMVVMSALGDPMTQRAFSAVSVPSEERLPAALVRPQRPSHGRAK